MAVVGLGPVALALLDAVLARPSPDLSGVWSRAPTPCVVLLGPELPWVDGVRYLGRDARAGGVLLPTRRTPAGPVDLFGRAVLRAVPQSLWPVGVLDAPDGLLALPLGAARPLDVDRLRAAREALA